MQLLFKVQQWVSLGLSEFYMLIWTSNKSFNISLGTLNKIVWNDFFSEKYITNFNWHNSVLLGLLRSKFTEKSGKNGRFDEKSHICKQKTFLIKPTVNQETLMKTPGFKE